MKKNITLLAIAALGMTAFFSCSKSSSSSSYSMTATVNGSNFSSSNCYGVSSGGIATVAGYSGTSSTSTSFPIIQLGFFNGTITTGTYAVNGTSNQIVIDSSSSAQVTASSGSITITATTPNIVGTFSATCTDGTTITNGKFTAKTY